MAGGDPEGLERRTIDVVPDSELRGKPVNQFTLWFGASMQITAIVVGALAVVFGADPLWAAAVGLVVTAVIFDPWAKRRFNPPAETIYPWTQTGSPDPVRV